MGQSFQVGTINLSTNLASKISFEVPKPPRSIKHDNKLTLPIPLVSRCTRTIKIWSERDLPDRIAVY